MSPPRFGGVRVLGIVAVAAVVAIAAAWVALRVAFPPDKVRTIVSAQLTRSLAREVRYAEASFGLFPPVRLTVRDYAIANPGGFDDGTTISGRSLHADLDPLALLRRRVVLRRLVFDRPALHLVMYADGTTNLDGLARADAPAPPGGREAPPPMDLSISALEVRDGRLLYDDVAAGKRTTFALASKLALAIQGGGQRISLDGRTTLRDLRRGALTAARAAELDSGLAALEWNITHRGKLDLATKRLALERLALQLGRTQLEASGLVENPGPKARLDLRARASDVDLGAVLGYLAAADARVLQGISGSGQLAFDLHVVGALGPDRLPSITGPLAISGGAFRYAGAPAGVEGLTFRARLAPDSIAIGDLTARVAGQPVRGRVLATRLRDPWVRFALDGTLDLAAIAPLVSPPDVKLAGRAQVDVAGQGPAKRPGDLALEGRARLDGVRVEAPALPKPVESISAEVALSGTHARVSKFSAKAGRSSFTLDAAVTRPLVLLAKVGEQPPAIVDFTLQSPYLDLAELLPATPGAPLTPNARGGGRVIVARLLKDKLDVANVDARVTLEPGIVNVPSYGLNAYGGRIEGDARFDLTDPAKPVYAVKGRADQVSADALLSAWTPARGVVEGSVGSTFELSGRGTTPQDAARTLTAVGLAAISGGNIGPVPALEEIAAKTGIGEFKELRFHAGHVPFRIEQGKLVTDDVTLQGPTGDWRLAGAIGFDGALDYAVSVTVPPEIVQRLGARAALAAGALADAEGRVLLDLRVTGHVKRPRVTLDAKATGERVAGRISSTLKEQGKKLERDLLDAYARRTTGDSTVSDSARRAARKEAERDLKKTAKDLLKGFLGGGSKDTTKP